MLRYQERTQTMSDGRRDADRHPLHHWAELLRCALTKKALAKEGVPFVEVDVRENAEARAYITEDLGYSQAPVCIVEDDTGQDRWSGFRPDNIKRIAHINN